MGSAETSEQPGATSTAPARPTGFRAAHAELRRAQKSSKGAPAYSLFVNRPLGRVLAAATFQLGMTPDQVTVVSACSTFAGVVAIALASPTVWAALGVTALLVLGYALDSADGQLARLRGGGSLSGEWLDHMFDAAKTPAIHLAVLVFAYRHLGTGDPRWLLVPLGFLVVATVAFFGMILNDLMAAKQRLARGAQAAPATPASTRPTLIRTLLKLPADYGLLCLAFLTLAAPPVLAVVYTLLGLGTTAYVALALPAWYRSVRLLDRS